MQERIKRLELYEQLLFPERIQSLQSFRLKKIEKKIVFNHESKSRLFKKFLKVITKLQYIEMVKSRTDEHNALLMAVVTNACCLSQSKHKLLSLVSNYELKFVLARQGDRVKQKRLRQEKRDKYGFAQNGFASRTQTDAAFENWFNTNKIYKYIAFGDRNDVNGYGCYNNHCLNQLESLLYNLTNNPINENVCAFNAMRCMDDINKLLIDGVLDENNNVIVKKICILVTWDGTPLSYVFSSGSNL